MLRWLSILIWILFLNATGQNLVQNPGFEVMTSCPSTGAAISNSAGWTSFKQSSDYFNSCCSFVGCSSPGNIDGYHLPHTGSGYAGIISYDKAGFYREALGSQLTVSLTVGQKYYLSFFVVLAVKQPNNAFASSNVGMKLSTVPYAAYSNEIPINNYAQIYSSNIMPDTVNWTQITGSFIADSSYSYIAIGNFFDDMHTDTTTVKSTSNKLYAYYFIDDVCVSTDSLYSVTWTDNIKSFYESGENLILSPNPTSGIAYIESSHDCISIVIHNSLGELIYENKNPSRDQQIDLSNHPAGIYFVRIKTSLGEKVLKLVKSD